MPSKVAGRTVVEFQTGVDVWSTVDQWAQEFKYELQAQDEASRLYQKTKGSSLFPLMAQVTRTEAAYHLEAWVRSFTLTRIYTFGTLQPEMIINSGGFVGKVARDKERKDVNVLLERLGVPPIE